MASVSFWADPDLESELVWNQCRLDDVVLPGLARVRGTLKADIEAKKSKGNDGADYSDNGLVPCDFTIELQMWEALQWDAYQALLPRLLPRKRGTARKLWTVQHPSCQLMGIAKVYIHEFPFPEPDDDGVVRVALKVLEYIPAPKPVTPPKKSTPEELITYEQGPNGEYIKVVDGQRYSHGGNPGRSTGSGEGDPAEGTPSGGDAGSSAGSAAGSMLGDYANRNAAKDASR